MPKIYQDACIQCKKIHTRQWHQNNAILVFCSRKCRWKHPLSKKASSKRFKNLWKNNRERMILNKLRGENHPKWKGDKVGYVGIHTWIKKNKPNEFCEYCFIKNKPTKDKRSYLNYANISGKYLRKISDWIILCYRCHILFDKSWLKGRTRNSNGQFSSLK